MSFPQRSDTLINVCQVQIQLQKCQIVTKCARISLRAVYMINHIAKEEAMITQSNLDCNTRKKHYNKCTFARIYCISLIKCILINNISHCFPIKPMFVLGAIQKATSFKKTYRVRWIWNQHLRQVAVCFYCAVFSQFFSWYDTVEDKQRSIKATLDTNAYN